MGRVTTEAKIDNLSDLYASRLGYRDAKDVRSLDIPNALVDTGAWGLSMPGRLIRQLGLNPKFTKKAMTAAGTAAGTIDVSVYEAVRLTIMGRECPMDVTEIADECPVLIGQIPLEALDFVVDMKAQKLIGNPAHGGEQIIELY